VRGQYLALFASNGKHSHALGRTLIARQRTGLPLTGVLGSFLLSPYAPGANPLPSFWPVRTRSSHPQHRYLASTMPFVSSTAPIASFFSQCYDTLKSLCTILEEFPDENPGKAETHLFNEELGRLNLWNDDVQADNGLLDHSLRKNAVLRSRVLELLTEFNNAAEKGITLSQLTLLPLLILFSCTQPC
jgi:hypothetical protein